jgi:phage shock protein A
VITLNGWKNNQNTTKTILTGDLKMKIFSRISDIISANLNDMIDGLENPEKMLRQAVREMETTIDNSRESIAKMMASQKMINRELEKNRQQVPMWVGRAETAVADNNDELARKAIARKQEHTKLVVALEEEQSESEKTVTTLRHQLGAMQVKLAEAKRRLVTLTARKQVADLRSKAVKASPGASFDENAFAKFDRMREKVEMAEAHADAINQLDSEMTLQIENSPQVEQQTVSPEVELELSELKKKIRS